MKPILGWTFVVLVAAGAGGAYWAMQRRTAAAVESPAAAEPVAQVSTELAKERVLTDTLSAIGDVSPGQLAGFGGQHRRGRFGGEWRGCLVGEA